LCVCFVLSCLCLFLICFRLHPSSSFSPLSPVIFHNAYLFSAAPFPFSVLLLVILFPFFAFVDSLLSFFFS
jgi:hypothetical protein